MKPHILLLPLAVTSATAQLLLPNFLRRHQQPTPQRPHQRPLTLMSSSSPPSSLASDPKPSGSPLLADVIPLDKSISIFSQFTRSVTEVDTRISDREKNTTVLAPSNQAVSRLPRKPWEDPEGATDPGVFAGVLGEDRATRNLRRFVEAHCVGVSPWKEGEKVKTMEGVEIWWKEEGNGRVIYPDGIKVLRVQGEVENGQLWIIDGVVNYGE